MTMPLIKTLAALKHLQVQYRFCEPRNRYTADSCDWHILDWTIKYLYRQHSKELQRTQACLSVSTHTALPTIPTGPQWPSCALSPAYGFPFCSDTRTKCPTTSQASFLSPLYPETYPEDQSDVQSCTIHA